MILSFDSLSLLAVMAVASVRASDVRMVTRATSAVTPTAPDSTGVFKIGGQCTMSWLPDTSGSSKWKDMTIDLMTGNNFAMVKLANVASGLDGTDPSTTSHTWTCPDVDPPSQIYFYQWTYGAEKDPQWTTRFLITAADGTSVSPPNATQPDGKAIGWGIGTLVGAASGSGSSDGSGATTSTPSQPDGSSSGTGTNASDTTESSALPSTTTAPSAATSATGLTNTSSPTSAAAASTAPSSAGRVSISAVAFGGVAFVAAAVAQIVL